MGSEELRVSCVQAIGVMLQTSKFIDTDGQIAAQFIPVLLAQIQGTSSRKVFVEAAWALSRLTCGNRAATEQVSAGFLLSALESCASEQRAAIRPFVICIRRVAGLPGINELLGRYIAANNAERSAQSVEFILNLCWIVAEDLRAR